MHLAIRGVSKTYINCARAWRDLTFGIPRGMYGSVGLDRAGESTLMRVIATLPERDTGGITRGDLDVVREPDRVRRTFGYLPREFGAYPSAGAERLLEGARTEAATLEGVS